MSTVWMLHMDRSSIAPDSNYFKKFDIAREALQKLLKKAGLSEYAGYITSVGYDDVTLELPVTIDIIEVKIIARKLANVLPEPNDYWIKEFGGGMVEIWRYLESGDPDDDFDPINII